MFHLVAQLIISEWIEEKNFDVWICTIQFPQDLPPEVREALENKLDDLKKQQDIHIRLAVERKIFLRNRKIRFFGESVILMHWIV